MKNFILLFSLLTMFTIMSCGDSKPSNESSEAVVEEVKQLDSLSTDMETINNEIDENSKALDNALLDLEKEFGQ